MKRLRGRIALTLYGLGLLGFFAAPKAADAALVMRWTSVAGLVLQDETTTIAFDLTFTRPGLAQWANFRKLLPKPKAIDDNLGALKLRKMDALFVSHSHFDHVVDAPWIAQKLGARLYGGISVERIARANEKRFAWNTFHFQKITDRQSFTVGKFVIRAYRRGHAPIFADLDYRFLGGEVPPEFNFGFDQYREGETWCFLIEHPEGRIFVDQGGQFFDAIADEVKGVDFMAIGVANKESVEAWVAKFVKPYRPKVLIPLHFDTFFLAPRRHKTRMLPGTELEALRAATAAASPETYFPIPAFGEEIVLPSTLSAVTVPSGVVPTPVPSTVPSGAVSATPSSVPSPVASPTPAPTPIPTVSVTPTPAATTVRR